MADQFDDTPVLYQTEAGTVALTPEEIAARQAAGTLEGSQLTEEQLGARYRQGVEEQVYGDAGDIAKTALERAASGVTLGLSDVVLSNDDPLYREAALARQRVNPGTAIVSELAGSVAPGLLTGGSGTAATVARLTPQGLLTRGAARILAEGGETALGRFGAATAAGAIEGAGAGAANYLSQMALQDREFSAQALLSEMALGGTLGGVAGSALSGLSTGAAKLLGAQRKGAGALAEELAQHGDAGAAKLADELASAGAGKGRVRYTDLIPPVEAKPGKASEYLAGMLRSVDDAAGRRTAVAKEVRDILRTVPDDAGFAPIRAEVESALQQHAQATATAKRWTTKLAKEITPDQLRLGNVPDLSLDRADEAVEALAGLDDATAQLEATMARVRTATGRASPEQLAAQQNAQRAAGVVGLPEPVAAPPSPWKAFADRAAEAAGAYETAGDLGAPLPSLGSIPVLGPALELYTKYKAARAGLRKLAGGTLPATPSAAAAVRVNQIRTKVASAAERVFSRAAPSVPKAVATTAVKAFASAEELGRLAGDPDAIRSAVAAQLVGVPEDLRKQAEDAAVKRVEYLAERAPKPPFADSPYAPPGWRPSTAQAKEWAETRWAAERPADALEHLLSGARSPVVAQVVRDLSPALWDAARQELSGRIEEIARKVPRSKRIALGLSFDLPLDGQLWPGYQPIQDSQPQPSQPDPRFGQPPAQSRQAELSQTPAERRSS